jgi:3-hydroxyisobutyrate dehydrogenase-like beta-hydroxyacid dehydrogenase
MNQLQKLNKYKRQFSGDAKSATIGFIGLGQMGYPMASNLITKLSPTKFIVHDYAFANAEKFKKEHSGAIIAMSPKEVASQCDLIITMLPASPQVKSVYLGKDGLIESLKKNTMVIDSSTIDVSTSKSLAQKLKEINVDLLDAPVSGIRN